MFYFNGFNAKANRAINLAVAQASALGHTCIGSEHLLLGLVSEDKRVLMRPAVRGLLGGPSKASLRINWPIKYCRAVLARASGFIAITKTIYLSLNP